MIQSRISKNYIDLLELNSLINEKNRTFRIIINIWWPFRFTFVIYNNITTLDKTQEHNNKKMPQLLTVYSSL